MTLYNCDVVSSVWTAIKAHANTNQGSKSVHFSLFFFARTDFKKLAWQDSVHTSRYCEIRQWRRKNITFIKVWKSILASWIGLGIAGHLTIRYYHDKWLTVTTISRYCDSAIIDIFLENPIMIHHDIFLSKMHVKRLSVSFLSLLKSKLLENIS